MPGFKIEIQVGKDPWCSNALVFATEEETNEYGQDLYARWVLVNKWRVIPTEKEPNYQFINGQLIGKGE